jgi:uncharacterized transporter YbjL
LTSSAACLAFATEWSGSDTPNICSAMVYPVSMTAKIVVAEVFLESLL